MTKPIKPVTKPALTATPTFSSDAEERAYWESHDSTELLDWTKAQKSRTTEAHALDPNHFIAAAPAFARCDQDCGQFPRRALPVID